MSPADRVLLSFPVGATRFNYRVAAIALRKGHVLACREDDDDYVMLPGGRVEMGEASPVALAREIAEELRVAGEIGPLSCVRLPSLITSAACAPVASATSIVLASRICRMNLVPPDMIVMMSARRLVPSLPFPGDRV